jgi:hypothetical protein
MQPRISLTTTVAPLCWQVAEDYELVERPSVGDTDIVARGKIEMRLYTILAGARTSNEIVDVRVTPLALKRMSIDYVPSSGELSTIFLDLANIVPSSPARKRDLEASASVRNLVLDFVKKWGVLSVPPKQVDLPPVLSELHSAISALRHQDGSLAAFLIAARQMRNALEVAQGNGRRSPLKKIQTLRGVTLVNDASGDRDDPRHVSLQARTLLQFSWLEFFAAISADTQFYRCANKQCQKLGLQRELGRPGPARKTCSESCRKKEGRRAA